jgi:SNF2 family DNA or RNA helicase
MRRLKTDKSIIQDLPPKNEMKVFMQLSDLQKRLYSQVVTSTMAEIEANKTDLRKKKGLVLRLLMQLKQIINHPYQYEHFQIQSFDQITTFESQLDGEIDGEEVAQSHENEKSSTKKTSKKVSKSSTIPSEKPISESSEPSDATKGIKDVNLDEFIDQSQKLSRLLDMIDEVLERGEKLLIFTQFKQMGSLLQTVLQQKYGFSVLFFHGGLSGEKRKEIVDEFQSTAMDSSPILILSLRAGGVGLNLTQAKVVFHYDRWWNPAVENQATDRAYRIGQTQQVNVYKFIAEGTIEEKIDAMLEEKRNLSDKIMQSAGESWITDFSEEELRELFSLKL